MKTCCCKAQSKARCVEVVSPIWSASMHICSCRKPYLSLQGKERVLPIFHIFKPYARPNQHVITPCPMTSKSTTVFDKILRLTQTWTLSVFVHKMPDHRMREQVAQFSNSHQVLLCLAVLPCTQSILACNRALCSKDNGLPVLSTSRLDLFHHIVFGMGGLVSLS